MKQKTSGGGGGSGGSGSRTTAGGGREIWREDEIEVADTLLNLSKLFERSEFLSQYTFTWGRTKKRSVLVSKSPPSPANQRRNSSESGLKKVKLTEATKSPSTPLSFFPSCSDSDGSDKSKQQSSLKKNSDKKTKEEFLEKLDGMAQQREHLRREIEAMKNLHQELTANNLELKAKRQQICFSRNTQNLQLWKKTMKMNLGQQQQQHCQQFIVDQNNGKLLPMLFPICSSNSNSNGGLGLVNQTAPRGIPDLNVSAEETFGFVAHSQPLDLHRVLTMDNDQRVRAAAAARKRRMVRMKENKNSMKLSRTCR